MESIVQSAATRTGEQILVRRLVAPDDAWAGRILPFLGHKGGIWKWQLETLLRKQFEGLAFRCYLADAAAPDAEQPNIVANICTIESADVGLFGHVYTLPAWRGKSIARILTQATMDDFAARGGQAMWLVTGYDTTPHRVYRQFGYESVTPGDGIMAWFAPNGRTELARRFAPGQKVHVRPMQWSDYATLNALSCSPDGPPHRSRALRVVGQNIVEESFLDLMHRVELGQPIQMLALTTESGWPVGWAIVQSDNKHEWSPWRAGPSSGPAFLDLYVHPNYASHYGELLGAVSLPAGKVIAVIDSVDLAREAALASAGFAVEGRLTSVYTWNDQAVDVLLMARSRA